MITSTGIVRSVTGAEVDHFQQYGFVRLKQILSEEEVERLRRGAELALKAFDSSPSSCDLTVLAHTGEETFPIPGPRRGGRTHAAQFCAAPFGSVRNPAKKILVDDFPSHRTRGHFLIDSGLWRRVDVLREFAFYSELPHIAAGMIDADAIRFYDDHLVVKEAGTRERTAFHQELSYLHVSGDRGCVFWVFLDRARQGQGCLGYVPGSHRWGQVFKPNFLISDAPCPGGEGTDLPGIEAAPESFGVQYVDADPGDILVQHVLTLYGMEGNRGCQPCRTLAYCYVDAALRHRRRPGVAIPPSHNPPPADGSEMDGVAHPVVWPRAEKEALAG